MSRRHILVLLLLVVVVSVAKNNEISAAGYLDVKNTECWDCHFTDTVPIRELFEVQGLDSGAQIDESFAYEVRVTNAWLTTLEKLEGALDVSNAPSLSFSSSISPELGDSVAGVIAQVGLPNPNDPINSVNLTEQQETVVLVDVPVGVTDLKITIVPENTDPALGPQLTVRLFAGRSEPDNQPDYNLKAAGPGQPITLHITDAREIAAAGFGPWAAQVRITPVSSQASPTNLFADTNFEVGLDKYFNVTDETVQFIEKLVDVEPEQSSAFGWIVTATGKPGPGEFVTVNMNATGHYQHEGGSEPDYAYVNREFRFNFISTPDGVGFEGETQAVIVESLADKVTVQRISELVGYISAFLLIASIYTGGMFGKTTRRQQNKWFGSAKRRVAFHNFLSYAIILTAVIHLVLFVSPWEKSFYWTNGLIWGGIGILAMLSLGVTGAIQVPMIRKWNYSMWRWTHFGLAIAAIVFTIVHMFLDGANLVGTQDFVNWTDPFDPRV